MDIATLTNAVYRLPVCRFVRAIYNHSSGEVATYGYDEVARHIYSGLRAHVRLTWPVSWLTAITGNQTFHNA